MCLLNFIFFCFSPVLHAPAALGSLFSSKTTLCASLCICSFCLEFSILPFAILFVIYTFCTSWIKCHWCWKVFPDAPSSSFSTSLFLFTPYHLILEAFGHVFVSGRKAGIIFIHLCISGDWHNARHIGGADEIHYICVRVWNLSDGIIFENYFDFWICK